jgi:hypothetical protein
MAQIREKFATQVDSKVLRKVRKLAEQEGRQLQVLVEEALTDLIDKRAGAKPRAAVMAAYQSSLDRFGGLSRSEQSGDFDPKPCDARRFQQPAAIEFLVSLQIISVTCH